VVTIAGSRDDHAVRSALHAGAAACVRITVEQPALVRAIRGAAEDRFVIPSDALPSLVGDSSDMTAAAALTAREADVLALVAQGHTNKDIARALHLTEGTVSGYVSTILTKLGVANRTEATGVAIQHGLTTTPGVVKPALRL
jgi:DNA-binding NarL/FixJ family response regulator